MIEVENIKTKKRMLQKLLIDGHYFIKVTVRDDITYWCCDKKAILKCGSVVRTCTVDNSYEILFGPTDHYHEDPKNRKVIVATPKRSIIRKSLSGSLSKAPIVMDHEDHSTPLGHDPNDRRLKPKERQIPFVDQPIEPAFGVEKIQFIRWKESQQHKLRIDGFYYSLREIYEKRCKWICSHSTANCTGFVSTCFVTGAHKLENDPKSVNHGHSVNDVPAMLRPYHRKEPLPNTENAVVRPAKEKLKSSEKIPFVEQPIEPISGVQEVKFVKWKEGKQHKLFIDGFFYSLKAIRKATCSWLCANAMANCHAAVKTVFAKGSHKLRFDPENMKHTHDVTDVPKMLKCYVDIPSSIESDKENVEPSSRGDVLRVEIPELPVKKNLTNLQKSAAINSADVSMHTQLLNLIPQEGVVEYQPPVDCEIEFAILFGLRRQMTTDQIFYELQGVYGLDAPSYESVSEHCNRFRRGYYPQTAPNPESTDDLQLTSMEVNIKDDADVSKEFLTVQPDI